MRDKGVSQWTSESGQVPAVCGKPDHSLLQTINIIEEPKFFDIEMIGLWLVGLAILGLTGTEQAAGSRGDLQ